MASEDKTSLLGRLLGPYRVLRGKRNLQLLFTGQIISAFGDWLYVVALVVLVYDLTQSATAVALLTFVRLLPYAIFLPLTGLLADRWDRRRMMIGADLGRAVSMLGLLLVRSPDTVWIAFPLVFATTSLSSLFRPAMDAIVPAVVPNEDELVDANTLLSQMEALALVLGPAVGGLLVALGRPQTAFLLNTMTFLVSAGTLALMRVSPREAPAREEEAGWWANTSAGFYFLFRQNEGVLAAFTIAIAGQTLFGGAFWSLGVVLAEQEFGLGSEGAGYLNAAYGLGGLLGGFVVRPVVAKLRLAQAFIVGTLVSSIIAGLFGLSPAGAMPFVILMLLGLSDVFGDIAGTTVIQTATPSELLGRVFGAFGSLLVFAMLVGALAVGPMIDAWGARTVAVVLAAAGVVLLLVCAPRMLRLEAALGPRIFARQVPVLSNLSLRVLDDLAVRMRPEHAAAGATIVREGEHGDKLYLIKSGEVEVVGRGEDSEEQELATIGGMDYFGEIALLRDVPRTATVRARGPVELYSLSREDFQELLKRSDELRRNMSETGEARYRNMQTHLLTRLLTRL